MHMVMLGVYFEIKICYACALTHEYLATLIITFLAERNAALCHERAK